MSLSAPDDLALGLLMSRGMLVADGPLFALPCSRLELPGARDDRLYFAQVREDPALEIEALRVGSTETAVVVSSGGCTALSLLASSAGKVVSVDLNRSQNHLVELKVAAVRGLDREASVGFLGGAQASERSRWETFVALQPLLSPGARRYWERHADWIRTGVIRCGVSERFIRTVLAGVRAAVYPRARVSALLACRTLDEQRAFFETRWNTRRWRWLFSLLLNRFVFRRTYDPAFFTYATASFPEHFRRLAERTLTEIPVRSNYFLHQMLTECYPSADVAPPFLTPAGHAALGDVHRRLQLVDGPLEELLRRTPDRSVHAFALSNICEWLAPDAVDRLFSEVVRTAVPGARVIFRNFVGATEVPVVLRHRLRENVQRGEALALRDRSVFASRVHVARVLP
jgi:S-adenosylmethionine-diacylglycerol 3-amino-3-carboxypropyl transferase